MVDEFRVMFRNIVVKIVNEGGLVKSNSVFCSIKVDSIFDVKRGVLKR